MKNKSKIIINGKKYKLEKTDKFENMGYAGLCDYKSKTLYHDGDLSTILHEIGHAIFQEHSFNQSIGIQLEEVIVDTIAKVLDENFNIRMRKKPKN